MDTEDRQEWIYLNGVLPSLEADRSAAIKNALASGESAEAKQLAINELAQVVGTSAAGIAARIGKIKVVLRQRIRMKLFFRLRKTGKLPVIKPLISWVI
ncbi:hypothetical protein [Pantoea sp. X85]|uniref:hypothetical protein n=1 Tax=Pantoea sp. X85 TaxID=3037258 RepID=UPI002413C9CC|nr:hypothetical protein [Pantoea sp. X85]WFL69982.1 hypothetical protein P6287_20490 [Pantoea sp. X85]